LGLLTVASIILIAVKENSATESGDLEGLVNNEESMRNPTWLYNIAKKEKPEDFSSG
jgi:hypothetical protein